MSISEINFFAGLDLGKKRDGSALVLVERVGDKYAGGLVEFHVRDIRSFPRGTDYVDVAQGVHNYCWSPTLLGRVRLLVDATGVGIAVAERFEGLGLSLCKVTITATGVRSKRVTARAFRKPT